MARGRQEVAHADRLLAEDAEHATPALRAIFEWFTREFPDDETIRTAWALLQEEPEGTRDPAGVVRHVLAQVQPGRVPLGRASVIELQERN